MVLINVGNLREGLTGIIAQKCLEECGIVVNMNSVPYDKKNALTTSGIRLGTPIVTKNGMDLEEMDVISEMMDSVLKSVKIISESEYDINASFREQMKNQVKDLCLRFPMC